MHSSRPIMILGVFLLPCIAIKPVTCEDAHWAQTWPCEILPLLSLGYFWIFNYTSRPLNWYQISFAVFTIMKLHLFWSVFVWCVQFNLITTLFYSSWKEIIATSQCIGTLTHPLTFGSERTTFHFLSANLLNRFSHKLKRTTFLC
jgi:hypothetical protein